VGVPSHLDLTHYLTTRQRWGRALATGVRWLRDIAMTLAAIGGLLCVAGVIAVHLLGISLVVFRSGSMSPAIRTGSVALVREVPATSVQVGDIVTVTTPRSPHPVTHRVVGIQPDPAAPDMPILTLRGDANPGPDPLPYQVATVKRVLVAVPGLGGVMTTLRSPLTLGATTLIVTALVTWAFWPRAPERAGVHRR
jgi:signal peptidase